MLLVPAVLLQVGLRDATAPWYFTNDSTYQIELAGDLVLHGHDPYGHDYDGSGLERFYPAAHDAAGRLRPQVALHHFAYFPGTALTAAAWRRRCRARSTTTALFVLLATLGAAPGGARSSRAPLDVRLAAGAALAANPLIVHGAWFGTADAPALLALVLAFALAGSRAPRLGGRQPRAPRSRSSSSRSSPCPFFAVMLSRCGAPAPTLLPRGRRLRRSLPRRAASRSSSPTRARSGTTRSPTAPAPTGSSATASRRSCSTPGVIDDRFGYYPFVPLALVVLAAAHGVAALEPAPGRDALWPAAAGFSISMFVLLFLSRVFQSSYLVWPLTGIALAFLLAGFRARFACACSAFTCAQRTCVMRA